MELLNVRLALVLAAVALLCASPSAIAQSFGPMRSAISAALPKDVVAARIDERPDGAVIHGRAKRHEDVSELMRALNGLVQTSRGIARVLERRPGTVRVQLLGAEAKQIELANVAVSGFQVELVRAASKRKGTTGEFIEFEVVLRQATTK